MVDVDRRTPGLTPAHAAGLRRLSARAAAAAAADHSTATSTSNIGPARKSLLSFTPFADSVVARLRAADVDVHTGLSPAEFARLEAELGFVFPPDLRAVLSAGLPVGPGFPDWRSSAAHLASAFDLTSAAVSLQVARNSLWPRSWGARPANPDRALRTARSHLKKAPLLVPLFNHCYIPSSPSLAGNPIFYVDETQVICCGFDLADFFKRLGSEEKRRKPAYLSARSMLLSSPSLSRRSLDSSGKPPRWIEFWSDAADHRRRRSSSSSSSSSSSTTSTSERYYEISCRPKLPQWVDEYLNQIGSVLKQGGWEESDVTEMCRADKSGAGSSDVADVEDDDVEMFVDRQAGLDLLLLTVDRLSGQLRRAGWSSADVSYALGFDTRPQRQQRPAKKLSPEMVERIRRLVESVTPAS